MDKFFELVFVFQMYVLLYLLVFGCQYQCNLMAGKTVCEMTCYVWSGTQNTTNLSIVTTTQSTQSRRMMNGDKM